MLKNRVSFIDIIMFYTIIVFIFLLRDLAVCQNTTENTDNFLDTLNATIKSSQDLGKSDRELQQNWTIHFQVQQVTVTTTHRIQMTLHHEHVLTKKGFDSMWLECISLYKKTINDVESQYYNGEIECLVTANTADVGAKRTVSQLEKQIAKWRKGYRYLKSLCEKENVEDLVPECIAESVKRDDYDEALKRLLIMKMNAMESLYNQHVTSLAELNECLKSTLSQFLEKMRTLSSELGRCHNHGGRNEQP